MFYQKLFALFLCLLLFGQTSAQNKPATETKNAEISAELKKEAVAFLREAAQDVANLRSPENRIGFSAEIASLMWFEDETEARTMFQSVVTDFRQLLTQVDAQYTALDAAPNEEVGIYQPFFGDAPTSQAKLARKFTKAAGVRQQIALSIAEHDPQMSYDFFIGTSQAVTNQQLRSMIESMDSGFEFRLLGKIAEKDADKALEAGRKMLAKGFSYQIINLLNKIYEKDSEKGAAFGNEIVQKIKSEKPKADDFYQYGVILNLGAENLEKIKNQPGKKPIFTEQALREIADLLALEILKRDGASASEMTGYISLVEKFSPARAAQIRQKLAANNEKKVSNQTTQTGDEAKPVIAAPESQDENLQKESELLSNVQSLSGKQLSKEEREKAISQARQSISKMKTGDEKFTALTALASQVALMGDKELASKIMEDARKLARTEPKNYRDFLQIWTLASAYAQIDADKAFPILEDAVLRINDTISAFIKVGEFIDANEEIIEDGEVQIGSFGGDVTRELLGSLGVANSPLRSLAIADFARTRAMTNKFDRLEARILAKMLVLRAILGEPQKIETGK